MGPCLGPWLHNNHFIIVYYILIAVLSFIVISYLLNTSWPKRVGNLITLQKSKVTQHKVTHQNIHHNFISCKYIDHYSYLILFRV